MSAEHEDTLTRKHLWQMDPKKERMVLLQPSQKKSVENKSKDLKCSQPWSMEQLSQTKGGEKKSGGATTDCWKT